jgi:hypothetical protein
VYLAKMPRYFASFGETTGGQGDDHDDEDEDRLDKSRRTASNHSASFNAGTGSNIGLFSSPPSTTSTPQSHEHVDRDSDERRKHSLRRQSSPVDHSDHDVASCSSLSSVRLLCPSPDGRFIHSFIQQGSDFFIETKRLPLEENNGTNSQNTAEGTESSTAFDSPAMVRTKLPPAIRAALEIDPVMELISVEGEGKPQPLTEERNPNLRLLPRICVYTRYAVFLLQLGYIPSSQYFMTSPSKSQSFVEGCVVSVTEPLEHLLLNSATSSSIIRTRPAPQHIFGYATVCPATSLAILTFDRALSEYSLILYHGTSGKTTAPLVWRTEQLDDPSQQDSIVDFCFGISHTLRLFAAVSIVLVKNSGDLLTAAPIVFEGSVVPRPVVTEALDYLQARLEQTKDRNTAPWRQCKAAYAYVMEVFGSGLDDAKSHFCTARLSGKVAEWPIQPQGPVLFASLSGESTPLRRTVIEPFGYTNVIGVAVGMQGGRVDFCVLSPTTALPRFAFESQVDRFDLDDIACKLGAVVECVDLKLRMGHSNHTTALALVRDPIIDTILHVVTPLVVASVSTSAVRLASNKLQGQSRNEAVQTSAWLCLGTTGASGVTIQGAIPSDSVDTGHQLLVCLSDGTTEPINVSQAQFYNELGNVFDSTSTKALKNSDAATAEALQLIESTPPLYTILKPLMQKIQMGLDSMGKIVGSQTSYRSITPETLAVVITVKEQCDNEVVLPLLELRKLVQVRRTQITSTLEGYRSQLSNLQQSAKDLKNRTAVLLEKMEKVQSNESILAQRGKALLQASQDLTPTVTQEEYEFFQLVKRTDAKSRKWEAQVDGLSVQADAVCEAIKVEGVSAATEGLNGNAGFLRLAHDILNGQEVNLEQARGHLQALEDQTQAIAGSAGLLDPSEEKSSNLP